MKYKLYIIVNSKISPIFQAITHFGEVGVSSGAGDANCFELLLTHFSRLMEAYQINENEMLLPD